MSYIIKSSSPFVSIKLTEVGRMQLSLGKLNFSHWAIGDSEINYSRETIVDANPSHVTLSATSMILRPFDRQPDIKSFIYPNSTGDAFQVINNSNLNVIKSVVNNKADEKGFFTLTGGNFETKTDSDHVKYTNYIASNIAGNSIFSGTTNLFINYSGVNIVALGLMVLLVYLVVLWLLIQMINHYKIYGIRYKV
jgi:hypothetical protein